MNETITVSARHGVVKLDNAINNTVFALWCGCQHGGKLTPLLLEKVISQTLVDMLFNNQVIIVTVIALYT